ncbi:MAG: 4Fe-4S dicluster domain-containing protein [Thermoleophilaceae bacterium]
MSAPVLDLAVDTPGAERMGFFTDTTVCIGCKACEVACKQWNDLPADGAAWAKGPSTYDHTESLSASTWRHVRFVERLAPSPEDRVAARDILAAGGGGAVPDIPAARGGRESVPSVEALGGAGAGAGAGEMPDLVSMAERASVGGGSPPVNGGPAPDGGDSPHGDGFDIRQAVENMDRWIFMSDVCKHCTNAGCLDACPTGALIRTEFHTVLLQQDVCNGCGYCIPACPFGVVDRDAIDGRAGKCTLCYDRLRDGMEPACAKACPTDSIQFGPYDELVDRARGRVIELERRGFDGAYLYGAGDDPDREIAGGLGAFFLFTEPPERFGLPTQAESPIQENVVPATLAALGAGAVAAAGVALAFLASGRRS